MTDQPIRTSGRGLGPLSWLGLALVAVVAVTGVFAALSTTSPSGYYGMMGGGAGWAMAFMAVPVVILILVLVLTLGGLREPSAYAALPVYAPPPQTAIEALEHRYARGEITRDQFLQMRADLTER